MRQIDADYLCDRLAKCKKRFGNSKYLTWDTAIKLVGKCPTIESEPRQWISLEDNPPPHNGSYIIAWETDAGRFSGGAVYKDGHWYWDGGFLIYGVKITHYMPFPEPPKGETK